MLDYYSDVLIQKLRGNRISIYSRTFWLCFCVYPMQSQADLAALKHKQEQERKDGVVENVATVLLDYDGTGTDQDLIKALDQKYDALKDKLLLEALKKQLGKLFRLCISGVLFFWPFS